MRRVFHFLVLVLACIASNADVANAAGCARVNSNILKACGPFLTEHEHEGTVVDIPHLDNIYFPTSNADNYFQQLDSMIHRGNIFWFRLCSSAYAVILQNFV